MKVFIQKNHFLLLLFLSSTLAQHPWTASAVVSPTQQIQQYIRADQLKEAEQLIDSLDGPQAQLSRLRGLVELKRRNFEQAITHFQNVLHLKPEWQSTWIYLAQAQLQLARYPDAQSSLSNCHIDIQNRPVFFQLKARVHLGSHQYEQALETLHAARKRFPSNPSISSDLIVTLTKIGLYSKASEEIRIFLTTPNLPIDSLLIVLQMLRQALHLPESLFILEKIILTYPNSAPLQSQAGYAYAFLGHHNTAAKLFYRAHLMGLNRAFEAADQFRLAHNTRQAIRMNSLVKKPQRRLSQRLSIFVSAQLYDRATALQPLLQNHRALNDLNRYHLAYAYLQTSQIEQAKSLAAQIKDLTRQKNINTMITRAQSMKNSG